MRIAKLALVAISVVVVSVAAAPANAGCADGIAREQLATLPEAIRLNRPFLEDAAVVALQARQKEHVRAAEFLMDWSEWFAGEFDTLLSADLNLACELLEKERDRGYLSDFISLTVLNRHNPILARLRATY